MNFREIRFIICIVLLLVYSACTKSGNSTSNPATVNPTITSLSISHGDFGAQVIITGTGFDANSKFYFNGILAPETISPSATQAYVTVPLAAGTGNITIKENGSTIAGPIFTYDKAFCVTTLAGGILGFNDGSGIAAQFNKPIGLVVDNNGNIYVADNGNNKIRKVSPTGLVTTFAGSGVAGNNDGSAASATFNGPSGLAIDATGNLYVADTNNNNIRKIAVDGTVTTIAGGGPSVSTNGTGKNASFNGPAGLAVDASGNIFVADELNSLVRKITAIGVVTTFAGTGNTGTIDGTGANASFNRPAGITIDKSGNLYVIERGSGLVRKITQQAVVTKYPSTGTNLSYPVGIVATDAGVYVTDTFNNVIKIISNSVVSIYAGLSNRPLVSMDGAFDQATMVYPAGIVADGNGNLYFTDGGSNEVKKISYQ